MSMFMQIILAAEPHLADRLALWWCILNKKYSLYGLENQGSRVQFLAGAGNFSLHYCLQNGSGAHLASHPMGTRGSFPWG
jgi:hypothetical protein